MSPKAFLRCGFLYASPVSIYIMCRNYVFVFKGTIELGCFKSGLEWGKKLAI